MNPFEFFLKYMTEMIGAGAEIFYKAGAGAATLGETQSLDCGETTAHLHGVEEEEHDEEGDGGAEGEAHSLQRVQRGHVAAHVAPLLLLPLPHTLLHGEGAEGAVHDEEDGDEEGGHAGGVHDRVRQLERLGCNR
jgi:hypothetical protein